MLWFPIVHNSVGGTVLPIWLQIHLATKIFPSWNQENKSNLTPHQALLVNCLLPDWDIYYWYMMSVSQHEYYWDCKKKFKQVHYEINFLFLALISKDFFVFKNLSSRLHELLESNVDGSTYRLEISLYWPVMMVIFRYLCPYLGESSRTNPPLLRFLFVSWIYFYFECLVC